MTAVLICAAGEGTRWHGGQPKQLAWLGDETIIHRIVRQVYDREQITSTVLTHDPVIADAAAPCWAYKPEKRRWLAETLLSSCPFWQGQTVILLGDVVYSRALMDTLFADTRPISIYGNNAECLALTFTFEGAPRIRKALHEIIEAAERRQGHGKLWNLQRILDGQEIEKHFIREDGVFVRVHDWSTDVDTPEKYRWVQRHLMETELIDDRLPIGTNHENQ